MRRFSRSNEGRRQEFVTKRHDREIAVELNGAARDGRYMPELWKK